ncbi:MAG: HD-GYP domain-containing protein [Acidimicrobiia bacterium]
MDKRSRTKLRLAAGYASAGLIVLGLLIWLENFPTVWEWILFAAAFIYLEWRAVEVNDRMLVSPSLMVALTGAVVFGRGSAALGVAVMAALALLTPLDIRERRWFQPIANFGQLIIAASISALVLEQFLPSNPSAIGRALPVVAVGAALAAVVYAAINYSMVAFAVRKVYDRRDVRPWSGLMKHVSSHIAMGFAGGLLGATYHIVGPLTLPMIFVVFAVSFLTFSSYGQLREAHEATIRGFIKALEAKDLYTRGHTERVAYFAQLVGEELGYRGTRLERLRIAALIHDVGKLAVPRDLIRKSGRLSDAEYAGMQRHAHMVEDILAEVDFLRPMVEIASNHHSRYDGSGYGGRGHDHGSRPSQEALILAAADAFDAMTSSRSYRTALSQRYAFQELRRESGAQFDPTVVEALERGIARTGLVYGSPDVEDEDEARRRAEGWMAHYA